MMSQIFKRLVGHADPGVALLTGSWAIGSTGAVGTKTAGSGMTLTRDGVGAYTIQLKGARQVSAGVPAFLHCDVNLYVDDADPTNDTDGHYIKLKTKVSSTGVCTFQCQDEGGTVREAPSGAKISVFAVVKLSSVTR